MAERYITTAQIMRATGRTRVQVIERSKREGWLCAQNCPGGALKFVAARLPVDIRLALSKNANAAKSVPASPAVVTDTAEEQLSGKAYANARESDRETACWRMALLKEWHAAKAAGLNAAVFCEHYNDGALPVLFQKLGTVSAPTLYRWDKQFRAQKASGLVPRYGLARGGDGESLQDFEKKWLEQFYLSPEQRTVTHCLELLKANYPATKCTYSVARRFLLSIPQVARDFARLGATAAGNKHLPYIIRDYSIYKSMECVVSDHHCLDRVCMYNGKLIRPWITTMQDYRSGKILGWCPSVSPSSLSIICAYYMMVLQYGSPKKLVFDNGKDYRSKFLNGSTEQVTVFTPDGLTEERQVFIQGAFGLLGSDVHFTRVYNGKSKARQERFFKKLAEYYSKDSGCYTGHDNHSKPEEVALYYRSINGMAKREDFPTYADAVRDLANTIQWIDAEFISQGEGMNNSTADAVFAANLADDIYHPDKDQLELALTQSTVRKVQNSMVMVDRVRYYADELFRYSGSDVLVRSPLTTDEYVLVCNADGAFVCRAYQSTLSEKSAGKQIFDNAGAARKNALLYLAERGSNELEIEPEFKTIAEVAERKYGSSELTAQFDVNRLASERQKELAPPPKAEPAEKETPALKSVFDADDKDYYTAQCGG